jgi:acylphosphatase
MREQVHVRIRGRVQGVFFRASTEERARALGLTGWVRNSPGGSVEAVAEGEQAALEHFLTWCRQGPPAAEVDAVDILSRGPATEGFSGFSVRK